MTTDPQNRFGHRVRALRKRKGWSQSELAERLGVTTQAVAKVEARSSSVRGVRRSTVIRYAEALGVSPRTLADPGQWFERGGGAPVGQDEVLAILGRHRGPMTCREVSEEHGADAWRILDALRRRGVVSLDRTRRPHEWRLVERQHGPEVLEVLSEVTAQIVVGTDGHRYIMIPIGEDLRDS